MAPRGVTPIIAKLRDFFLQRKFNISQRHEGVNYVPRDQPLPNLPGGPSHQLSANDYCLRDGRRMSHRAKSVYEAGQPRLAAGTDGAATQPRLPRPGFGYNLESGKGL